MPYCPATVHPRNTVYYTPVSKLLFKEVGINCLVLVITSHVLYICQIVTPCLINMQLIIIDINK